jgi:hypothetical protein
LILTGRRIDGNMKSTENDNEGSAEIHLRNNQC